MADYFKPLVSFSGFRQEPSRFLKPLNLDAEQNKAGWWFFTNPSEKYARQIGFIFPNFRVKMKTYLSCHHLVVVQWGSQNNIKIIGF